jgi:hypothetical protein
MSPRIVLSLWCLPKGGQRPHNVAPRAIPSYSCTALSDHEIHDIVSVPLGVYAAQIPAPSRIGVVERDELLIDQRGHELNHKEWISGGLLED